MSNHSLAFLSDAGKLGRTAHSRPPISSCSGTSNPTVFCPRLGTLRLKWHWRKCFDLHWKILVSSRYKFTDPTASQINNALSIVACNATGLQ